MGTSLRTGLVVAAALVAALALGATAASAGPKFTRTQAFVDTTFALNCQFTEAGLAQGVTTETVTCSATAFADYSCGSSSRLRGIEGAAVSQSGRFPVRHAQASGTIRVSPQLPCPAGQQAVPFSVCYADVTFTGSAGNSVTLQGEFCRGPDDV